jgi:hypothetical protein
MENGGKPERKMNRMNEKSGYTRNSGNAGRPTP